MKTEFILIKKAFNKVKEEIEGLRKAILENIKEDKIREIEISNLKKEIKLLKIRLNKIENFKKKEIVFEKGNIIGNVETKKVHHISCHYIKNLREENKVEFNSVKEALKKGYQRCTCIFNS